MASEGAAAIRNLAVFIGCLVGAAAAHELGHTVVAWAQGIPAVPTLLKEYTLQAQVPWAQHTWIALGGVASSLLLSTTAVLWFARRAPAGGDLVLAGVLLMPVAYSVRFALAGRGHDGIEWPAAQAALGASPSGHLVDYLFVVVCAAGLLAWLARRRTQLRIRSFVAALGLQVIGLVVLMVLQAANNAAFDRFFPDTDVVGVPPAIEALARRTGR